MDNDNRVLKRIKKIYKEGKFKFDYRDLSIVPAAEGNQLIYEKLKTNTPFFVGRGGATEMRCIDEYLSSGNYSEKIKNEISMLSGVFPNDQNSLNRFCELYMQSMETADVLVLWGVGAESKVVHQKCRNAEFTELHALEPYYFDNPWSAALSDKKILVIHPFKESIITQYSRREYIFPNRDVLPKFQSLECIKAVQSMAGETTEFDSWFEALDYMKKEISSKDFDVAIIGAGAYGLPLASFCKQLGKQAIQMSGATQLLFGIKGKRWENHPIISKFYNESWVRPMESETPSQKNRVEGGSYW